MFVISNAVTPSYTFGISIVFPELSRINLNPRPVVWGRGLLLANKALLRAREVGVVEGRGYLPAR